jgi:hypothetical protein
MRGLLAVLVPIAACAASTARFPLREPFTRDTDLDPVSVACRPDPSQKEPARVACCPREYVSPFVWDRIDTTVFGRLSRILSLDVTGEARNANSLDEVADSSWFENRGVSSPAQKATGACTPDDLLPSEVADGTWLIDHGKDNGSSVGFRVQVPGKGIYLLKADDPEAPELGSAASVIGAAIYHAAGFLTSCEQIVYVRRAQFTLAPALVVLGNDGASHPFDDAALGAALASLPRRGDLRRMQASKWLPGVTIGPFRYETTRDDDPNDIIRHEDRRELRGSKLLAAWLDHWDAREQNSMDVWIAKDPAHKRSSPGYVRHYLIDTSDVFGQPMAPVTLAKRLGHSYQIDLRDIAMDFVTFGLMTRPWDRAAVVHGHERFGFFTANDFEPADWKPAYPNPAFLRMTERDAAWAARLIARLSRDDIHALVAAGQFSDLKETDYLAQVLVLRQQRILARYLTRLSPIADARFEADGRVCAVDLARLREVVPADRFRYQIVESGAAQHTRLTAELRPAGVVCFTPRRIGPSAIPDTDPARIVVFHVDNGTGAGPIDIHAYDLGPERGLRIVGLVRKEPE